MLFVFPVQLRLAAVKLGVFLNGITVVVFFNQLIDRLLSRLKLNRHAPLTINPKNSVDYFPVVLSYIIKIPFTISIVKHMIPAYGWRVTINKNTVITDNTTPVINRCLFHNGLSR